MSKEEALKNHKNPPLNSLLHDARLERGWSQQQLAELLGTTSVNISRWENGSNFPTPYYRQKLCEVFGKTPAELGLIPRSHATKIWTVPFIRNPFFTGREPTPGIAPRAALDHQNGCADPGAGPLWTRRHRQNADRSRIRFSLW